ncbi:ATP-binding protein [Paenibacillus sp. FJAT-26967]|uniref:ATP-binding protein n=1 Tax=Paenibacillus sp. FJAT-26967 TaxID=1729690 RepID=UPI0008391F6B|nr:ATP-binding protein [Paenibacillus sp. FJAT-26967]
MTKKKHYIWVTLLIWMFIHLLEGSIALASPDVINERLNAHPVLLTNWEYTWDGGDGDFWWNAVPDWKPVDKLKNPADRMGRKDLWLRVRIPDSSKFSDPGILMKGYDNVEIYNEQGLIYRFGDWKSSKKHPYYGTPERIVPLPGGTQGMLYFHLNSGSSNIGIKEGVLYGSESGFVKQMVRAEFGRAVLGVTYVLAGLVALYVYIAFRGNKVFLDFSLFSASFGIYSICRTSVIYLVFDHPALLTYAELVSLFAGVIGILLFVEHLLGAGKFEYIRRIWQIHLIYAIGTILLHTWQVFSVMAIIDIYQIVLLSTMPLVLVRIAQCAVKRTEGARLLLAGTIIICLAGVLDIIQYRLSLSMMFAPLTYLGVLAFIFMLIILLIRRFTDMMLQVRRTEKLSLVGQMAAGMAHELRNPLTIISGFLQLSQKQAGSASYLGMMSSEVSRMNEIISDFLLLSKPVNSRFDRHHLMPLLQETLELFDNQCRDAGVRVILEEEGKVPEIDCDFNQLKQVFINMVKNSIEAMPEGGQLQITLSVLTKHRVQIRLADQGSGINPEDLSRIGEPFFTTKDNGTGLGLMVSNKIIENHSGKLNISSRPGVGTTIDIILPVEIKTT